MAVCASPTTGSAFLSGTLDYLDCQSRGIGAEGYQSLAATGSPVVVTLTSLLTIFVALFGIRLLMGQSLHIRDAVLAAVKIGVVLLIATSWPAWRTIAYDVVLKAPGEVSAVLGADTQGLVARLQGVDDTIVALTLFGSGRLEATDTGQSTMAKSQTLRPPPISDELALGFGRMAFLSGTIGTLGGTRLIGGIMLALAPLFSGLLLFEATRGLFFGWLRALAALAIGALIVTVIQNAQLAMLEPWLTDTLARRVARYATPAAPVELFVLTTAFVLIQFVALIVVVRLSFMLHLPNPTSLEMGPSSKSAQPGASIATAAAAPHSRSDVTSQVTSRALAVSDAIATSQRREAMAAGLRVDRGGRQARSGETSGSGYADMSASRRRAINRVSAGATKRDQRV